MTPTDILPARIPTASDANAVRGTSSKSGNDGKDKGDAGFRDLLKQIAGDKSGEKSAETTARGKEAAAHGRTRTLDAAKAALAELRGRQSKEARVPEGAEKDGEVEATAKTDDADAESALDVTEEAGASSNAVAMLLSLAHKGDTTHRDQPGSNQGGAAGPDPTLGDDAAATAMAEKSLRDVKVTSVKVETHFAAVRTDAATTGFAQRLALSQMSSGNAQPGAAVDASKGKTEGKLELEATAVSGTEKGGEVRPSRGQMFAARGDHRGADSAGQGAAKSSGEGKSAAATVGAGSTERSVTPNVDASQGAQVATPLQQLSNRLLATAHELQQAASATPASSVGTEAASAPPVRVLSINLHPEELGSVTVRMTMVAGSLDVQIDAEMPDTAQMLRADSDQISDLLRSAGIQVDGVTVRAASPDFVSTSGGSTSSFFDQQPQSQSGGASSDGRGFGGQRRGDDPSQSFGRAANSGQDDENRTQRGRGAGLYV